VILHRKLGRWLQPGGHIDPVDSSVLQGALREANEEIGLKLDPETARLFDLDIHVIPANHGEPEHSHFDIRYLFETARQPLNAGADVAEAKWIDIDEWTRAETDGGLARVRNKLLDR
jgi:8-oxo-dGTP pyrophosphatase MutT (NUDIX family)